MWGNAVKKSFYWKKSHEISWTLCQGLLSCLCEKSILSQQLLMVTLFNYQYMIMKWVIMTFSIDLPCSPQVRQNQSSLSSYSVVTSYEFYDDFSTHFSMIFDEKTCTKVVAELTIRNVRVICSLVFMQLYRFPTRQTHWKIPYTALSTKLM